MTGWRVARPEKPRSSARRAQSNSSRPGAPGTVFGIPIPIFTSPPPSSRTQTISERATLLGCHPRCKAHLDTWPALRSGQAGLLVERLVVPEEELLVHDAALVPDPDGGHVDGVRLAGRGDE